MSYSDREAVVLESILPRLREDGFQVFVHPSSQMLPPFMNHYLPDAIAVRDDRRLAIEVVSDEPSSRSKLNGLRGLFEGRPDWELMVYWVSGTATDLKISKFDLSTIVASLTEVEILLQTNHLVSALLQGWATFEAAARYVLPDPSASSFSHARLIEILASSGQVTPAEADRLRVIGDLRNLVSHGDLQAIIHSDVTYELLSIVRAMLADLPSTTTN